MSEPVTTTHDGPLPAGGFATWLAGMEQALAGDGESDVPCGTCTACCRSSQFVHVEPDETDALAHIPADLLFPAPHSERGDLLLGYDQLGRCPMLRDDGCSIYEHRPRACRTYDCRIFPASGVEVDADQAAVGRQAARWQFAHPTLDDQVLHESVQAAAQFVAEHPEALPEGSVPVNATQRAVLAVRLHNSLG